MREPGAPQVKNSLRAVNDRYEDAEDEPPPVRVVVAEGTEDVCIKARRPQGRAVQRLGLLQMLWGCCRCLVAATHAALGKRSMLPWESQGRSCGWCAFSARGRREGRKDVRGPVCRRALVCVWCGWRCEHPSS